MSRQDLPQGVHLPAPIVAQVLEESRRTAPRESCGLLVGHRSNRLLNVLEAWPMRNESSGDNAFAIDGIALLEAEDEAERKGLEVLGPYHSHPSGLLQPSDQDRRVARAWPGTLWVIVNAGVSRGPNWSAWWSQGGRLSGLKTRAAVLSSAVP